MLAYFLEMTGFELIEINEKKIIYLIIVFIIGSVLLALFRWYLAGYETKRKNLLKKKKNYQAVSSSTPLDNPISTARKIAIESVDKRFSIFRRLIFSTIFIVWIIALAFPFLGNIPATAVSFIVASSSIIIGIAAKPFIENTIAGLVITFSRLLTAGDTISVDGNYGTIEDITVTHTVIKNWDWKRYVIPNSKMIAKEFINYTLRDNHIWAYVEFWVSVQYDIKSIEKIAIECAKNSSYFSAHEDPSFWVMEMDKEGVKCWIAAWSDSPAKAWELKSDIRQNLAQQFKELGIKTHQYVLDLNKPEYN